MAVDVTKELDALQATLNEVTEKAQDLKIQVASDSAEEYEKLEAQRDDLVRQVAPRKVRWLCGGKDADKLGIGKLDAQIQEIVGVISRVGEKHSLMFAIHKLDSQAQVIRNAIANLQRFSADLPPRI